jgi:hypothetical protein
VPRNVGLWGEIPSGFADGRKRERSILGIIRPMAGRLAARPRLVYLLLTPKESSIFTSLMIFSFGETERERIEIDVRDFERAPAGDCFDDNWLRVDIHVQAGGFHGSAPAAFTTSALAKFLSELHPLFETLNGSAEFSTMEGQLSLRLVGDGKGHIKLLGVVEDRPGDGNRLHFALQFDQSQLGMSIGELKKVISTFPVRTT